MLKHEPLLLHVSASSLPAASSLLKSALNSGFRESGIVPSSRTPYPTVAVRGMGLGLSTPFVRGMKGGEEYLKFWVEEANSRFRWNEIRTIRLSKEIEKLAVGRRKAGFKTFDAEWKLLPEVGTRNHCSVTVMDEGGEEGDCSVVVFGGYGDGGEGRGERVGNWVKRLKKRGGKWGTEWEVMKCENEELFQPTRNLSCCMLPFKNSSQTIAIFGGRTSPSSPNCNLLLYSYSTNTFSLPFYSLANGAIPSPRYGHTMTSLSGRNGIMAALVGGRDNERAYGDVHLLVCDDFKELKFSWRRFELPSPIFNHTACSMPSSGSVVESILISGGLSDPAKVLDKGLEGGIIQITSNGDGVEWIRPIKNVDVFERTFGSCMGKAEFADKGAGDGSVSNSRYIVKSGGVAACADPNVPIMTLSYQHSPSVISSVPLSHVLHPSVEVIDGSGMVNHTMEVVEGEGCMEALLLGGGVGAFAFRGINSPSYLVTIRMEGSGNAVDGLPSSTPSSEAPAASDPFNNFGINSVSPNSNPPCVLVQPKNVKKVKIALESLSALNKDYRINKSTSMPGVMAIPVHSLEMLKAVLSGNAEWASVVVGTSEEESPPLSKLLISSNPSNNSTMSNEERKLSPPQRAVMEFFKGDEKEGRKWVKDKVVCPKGLEKLGDDVLVVPKGAYSDAFFNGGGSRGEFWKLLSKHTKSGRIVKYGAISPDSPTRQSGHRILFPPLPNDSGVSESTGEGSPGWVCVREFGVKQWFDCTRVMFCRGNNSEKKRFASLVKPDEKILDLYAGIGYYTLPALLAHPSTFVYCCEWNPDAVYALKYNLKDNGVEDRAKVKEGDSRLVDYRGLVDRVSLGLLPSSEGCWENAVRALKEEGGWVHVHGNVPTSERALFGRWVAHRMLKFREGWGAWCKHTEKVKSFAPKVDHLVADIYLGPEGEIEGVNVVGGVIKVGEGGGGDCFNAAEGMEDLSCALKEGFALGDQKWMAPLQAPLAKGDEEGTTKKVGFSDDVDERVFDPSSSAAREELGGEEEEEEDDDDGDGFMGGMFEGGYDDEFEEIPADSEHPQEENPNDDTEFAPNYLISGVLAGLYELPPLWLLKTQTGFGRRVRYKNPIARRLNDVEGVGWEKKEDCEVGGVKVSVNELCLPRFETAKEGGGVEMKTFQVFRVDIGNAMRDLNAELADVARQSKIQDKTGISVSNAAGSWHSRPDFFNKWKGTKSVDTLWEVVVEVLKSLEAKVGEDCKVEPRKLELVRDSVESWINISKEGSWNRLHTHAGAAWSAVYYVEKGEGGKAYSGRLVLKPTPHEKENEWEMTTEEMARFKGNGGKVGKEVLDRADYYDIDAENGCLVVFPGWLHHAVLPYVVVGGGGETKKERISVALNVNVN